MKDLYRIGRIGKPHGLHGELTVQVEDDVFDRTGSDCLIIEVEGIMVPFFIDEYRFRSDTVCLMTLDGVTTPDRAAALTGCDVYFPRQEADGQDTMASIIGYTVIDTRTGAEIGRIASIDTQTANTLFCLDNGTLIPAHEDTIDVIEDGRVRMNVPEGLLEINN